MFCARVGVWILQQKQHGARTVVAYCKNMEAEMSYIATAITYYLIYCAVMMALTAVVVTSWCKGYAEGVKDGQM